jgi:hypothetical protein
MLDHHRRTESGPSGLGLKVPAPGIAPFLVACAPTAECLEAWNAGAFHATDEIAQSWLKFVGDRLAKDTALPQQIAACRDVNDFIVVYSQFWQQAAKDYFAEYSVIANTACSAMRSAMEATTSGRV